MKEYEEYDPWLQEDNFDIWEVYWVETSMTHENRKGDIAVERGVWGADYVWVLPSAPVWAVDK